MRRDENGHILISLDDWLKAGLSYKMYEHDKQRGYLQTGNYAGGKGNKVEILYSTITKIERLEALTTEFGDIEERTKTDFLAEKDNLLPIISVETIQKIKDLDVYESNEPQRIARTEAWCKFWRMLNKKIAKKHGFQSVADMQNELFKCYLNDQKKNLVLTPKPITNERVFNRLALTYSKKGYTALIHKNIGNKHAQKITPIIHAKLIQIASDRVKHSFEDIGLIYNGFAKENNLDLLTVKIIKSYLNRPINKAIWYYNRHGKHEGERVLRPEIMRNAPSRPDALWSIDGTTMQLYYKDANDKMKSDLYIVLVSDAYSGAIIGYSIGFAETSGLVIDALRSAVQTHGYKPYQLQYDNSSANISKVVKSLMANITHVGFACRPYAAKGKYIEGVIGHFQQRELRKFKEFKGGNITTVSPNSKANPELIAELKKYPQFLKTEKGVIESFEKAVTDWNNRGEERNKYGEFIGSAKIEKYNEIHEDRELLTFYEKIALFAVEITNNKRTDGCYKYGTRGIEITVNGNKMNYIVPDGDDIGDFIFSRNHLDRAFKVRINVAVEKPGIITLYDKKYKFIAEAYDKERYASCVADMKANPKANYMQKIKTFIAKADATGYAAAQAELEAQRQVLQEAGYFGATGTDGAYTSWSDTPKIIENKIQGNLEDKRNGVGRTDKMLTDLEKALSRIG